MKKMKTLSSVLLLFTLLFAACGKNDDDNPNTYPKQVSVTYRLSSTSATTLSNANYTNQSGGSDQIQNFSLPFSKTISMTVNYGDPLYLTFYDSNGSQVKMEILVNNEVVNTKTYSTTSGTVDYYFK